MSPELLHNLIQGWVLLTSSIAVYCVARTDGWHKWGYIAGALSEPAWLYAAYVADQWGVLLLTVWWSWWWVVGAWRRFS